MSREEEIQKAAKIFYASSDDYTVYKKGFEAGAKWQKKKDQETIELAEEHAMLAGMNKMKEEMMKDAVEAFVNIYENTDDSNYVEFVTEQSPYKFKETEKCKIIIVKEE